MTQLASVRPSTAKPTNEFESDLERSLDILVSALREILNKGISIDDNLDAFRTTITTSATPGVETAIAHGLKRRPIGCLVLEKDKAGQIFLGTSGKDAERYYVQSDVASVTATLLIL